MSVRSTVELTRAQAEARTIALLIRKFEKLLPATMGEYSDEQLEEIIQKMSDEEMPNGNCFENYRIVP